MWWRTGVLVILGTEEVTRKQQGVGTALRTLRALRVALDKTQGLAGTTLVRVARVARVA